MTEAPVGHVILQVKCLTGASYFIAAPSIREAWRDASTNGMLYFELPNGGVIVPLHAIGEICPAPQQVLDAMAQSKGSA